MSQFTFFPAPSDPGYAQIYDDASPTPNPIGSPVAIPAGTTVPVTAPHGTVMTSDMDVSVMDVLSGETKPLPKSKISFKDASDASAFTDLYDNKFDGNLYPSINIPRRELKDSASAGIGIYASLDGLIDDTIDDIPDSAVTVNGTAFGSAKATSSLDVPVKDDAGTAVGAKVGGEWIVKRDPLILDFTGNYQYSQEITINSYNAGTFNTPSTSGSMGTLTYSKNGGAYTAIATPGTFAIGDTVRFFRTGTGTAQLVWLR